MDSEENEVELGGMYSQIPNSCPLPSEITVWSMTCLFFTDLNMALVGTVDVFMLPSHVWMDDKNYTSTAPHTQAMTLTSIGSEHDFIMSIH